VIAEFKKVIKIETDEIKDRTKWGFKALKWIVKIYYSMGDHNAVSQNFNAILQDYAHLLVENERGVNKLFEYISDCPLIKELYQNTLNKLEDIGNKKASLRLEIKLAKELLKRGEYREMDKLLDEMHDRCKIDGQDDSSKGNQLIEIYAMKIERHLRSPSPDFKSLKSLYARANVIKGLSNPRNTGIQHECGGKVFLRERNYASANTDFIEAFKGYDSAGARSHAIKCLRYLILSNMLSNSDINPFDDSRAKSYQSTPEIGSMLEIIESYTSRDIKRFETVLKRNKEDIESDPFISDYMQDLMKKLRSHMVKSLVRPYSNITLGYISNVLRLDTKEAESLLVEMILDKEISGKLDQVNQTLFLNRNNSITYNKLSSWVKNLTSLTNSVTGRIN